MYCFYLRQKTRKTTVKKAVIAVVFLGFRATFRGMYGYFHIAYP